MLIDSILTRVFYEKELIIHPEEWTGDNGDAELIGADGDRE